MQTSSASGDAIRGVDSTRRRSGWLGRAWWVLRVLVGAMLLFGSLFDPAGRLAAVAQAPRRRRRRRRI